MSVRKGDENLLGLIRSLSARIDRLEKYGARTRRNDVRIGDLLISWDEDQSMMTMRNLATGGLPVTVHVP
jgi:hypothetical protein